MPRLVAVLIASVTAWALLAGAAHATFPGANGKIAFAKLGFGTEPGPASYPDIWTMNPDGTGAVNLTRTHGHYDQSPSWSPDRTQIAYESWNGNSWAIYVINANGSERRLVNGSGNCLDAAWSPDGTKIAMSCDRFAPADSIWVANVDGSGSTQLTSADHPVDTEPAWSPDGSKIAWSAFGDLWKMDADGSNKTMLVDNPQFAKINDVTWSPDGTEIAFSGDRDCVGCSKTDIYRVYSDGTGLTRFGYTPDTVDGLVYSPDGTKILFDSCEMRDATAFCYDLALFTMDRDGTNIQPIPGNEDDLGYRPDWQVAGPPFVPAPPTPGQIVFARDNWDHRELPNTGHLDYLEIYAMNPDGSRLRRLTGNLFEDTDPAWSTDGARIVFSSRRDGNFEIYKMNADGSGQTRLTDHADSDRDPTWSADGSRIAFTRYDATAQRDRLMMNSDGSDVHPLFASPPSVSDQQPDWSPTADRIAFNRGGDIYAVNPDGTGLTPLTDDVEFPYQDSHPNWAPNGFIIGFTRYNAATQDTQIWHMLLDGQVETQFTYAPGGAWGSSWDPEGQHVVYMNSSHLWTHGPGGPIALTTPPPHYNVWPDVQPVFGYARPKGATPTRISLVTAYQPCTASNREHGPPLAFASCSPPQKASSFLTVGTGDSNGLPARNEGHLLWRVIPGVPSNPADEADVALELFLDDVFTEELSDYTGELRASFSVRATDRNNSPAPVAATVQDFPIAFSAPCTANPDPAEGSACTVSTTVDALIPGAVAEGMRAKLQLDQVTVFDGGTDGDGDTTGDNTLFATPGIFVP